MPKPIITLTTDFGVQSQGIGNMEGVIRGINDDVHIIHLMHGLPDFDIRSAARTMETVHYMPVGYHVCVVDPGVGTKRRALILQTQRGDYLIGPDNGVLLPAATLLGGCSQAVEITNQRYMVLPISPIFHGRHIFAPTAAHLAAGVPIEDFGSVVDVSGLVTAPYPEAELQEDQLTAEVIHINKFGSLHLNIRHELWDQFGAVVGGRVQFIAGDTSLTLPVGKTFGEVEPQQPLILKDDYGRIEVALNLGSFAKIYNMKVGDRCTIQRL